MNTVIFDIGNVLLDFSPERYLRDTFGPEAPLELLHRASFGSPQWELLDRVECTQREAKEKLQAQYPHLREELEEIFPGWFSSLVPLEDGISALKGVKKQGFRVYALSNFHTEAFEYVRERYSWFSLFDGWTVSAHVNSLKPEARIYQTLLADHDIQVGEACFLDDSLANLQSAACFGLEGLWVQTPDMVTELLGDRLGVRLRP